ncbi:unnamed protein product [Didymodactylos carnosus]|uniref:Uncharacterized protein n=2 Tax=Didymodactylos carnosus TaxID=1234261 RepID=A0A8S2GMA0_9BILA|nr:unnamed protein product [Didymodactylos carnosus]CAF3533727.1 unnamed protein product [Didymodactylos carnosus]
MERLGREVRLSLKRLTVQSRTDKQHTGTFTTREETIRGQDEQGEQDEQRKQDTQERHQLTQASQEEGSAMERQHRDRFAALRERVQQRLQQRSQLQTCFLRTQATQSNENWDEPEPQQPARITSSEIEGQTGDT